MTTWIFAVILALQGSQASLYVPKDKVQKAPSSRTVVGVVNGKNITAGQVQDLLWDWAAYDVTQELMTGVLVEDAAKEAGVTVSDKEILEYAETLITDLRKALPPGRSIEDEVRLKGVPMSRLLMRSRIEVMVRKIALSRIKPEDARQLSRIVVVAKTRDETGKLEAKKRAEDALARVRSGEEWNALVQSLSDDPQTKPKNGSIGWLLPMEMGDAASTALKDVKAGGCTELIELNGTWTIYRVDQVGPPPADEWKKVQDGFLSRKTADVYEDIKKKAKVENKIVAPNPKPPTGG